MAAVSAWACVAPRKSRPRKTKLAARGGDVIEVLPTTEINYYKRDPENTSKMVIAGSTFGCWAKFSLICDTGWLGAIWCLLIATLTCPAEQEILGVPVKDGGWDAAFFTMFLVVVFVGLRIVRSAPAASWLAWRLTPRRMNGSRCRSGPGRTGSARLRLRALRRRLRLGRRSREGLGTLEIARLGWQCLCSGRRAARWLGRRRRGEHRLWRLRVRGRDPRSWWLLGAAAIYPRQLREDLRHLGGFASCGVCRGPGLLFSCKGHRAAALCKGPRANAVRKSLGAVKMGADPRTEDALKSRSATKMGTDPRTGNMQKGRRAIGRLCSPSPPGLPGVLLRLRRHGSLLVWAAGLLAAGTMVACLGVKWCPAAFFSEVYCQDLCKGFFCDGFRLALYAAVRVGEASHPGPGGSRKAARKRAQKQALTNAFAKGPAGLNALLKPLIRAALQEVLQQSLGGDGLAALLSGAGAPASQAAASQRHVTLQGPKGKGKSKDAGANAGADAAGVPADGGVSSGAAVEPAKPPRKSADQVEPKGKGKGKGGKDSKGGKGPVSADSSASPSGGVGKGDAQSFARMVADWSSRAGTASSPAGVPGHAASEDWVENRWRARPSFFNCQGFADNIDDIEEALEAGSAFIAQVGAKDLKQSVSMLSGGCPSGTVLLYLGAESDDLDAVRKDFHVESRHVPGILKGQHRLRKCFCILIDGASPKLAPAVDFVKAAAPRIKDRPASVVMRASFFKEFCGDSYAQVKARPAQAIRRWSGRLLPADPGAIVDSWGWVTKGLDEVTGLVRVTRESAAALLAASGTLNDVAAFFCPVNWADFAVSVPSLLWCNREEAEAPEAYVARVRKLAADHGLHCVGTKLAVRLDALDPRIIPKKGGWELRGALVEWHLVDIQSLLEQSGFSEVEVQSRTHRRGGHVWRFQAVRPDFREFVPIELVSDDGAELVCEASRCGPKRVRREIQPVRPERTQSFRPAPLADFIRTAAPKALPKKPDLSLQKPKPGSAPPMDVDDDDAADDDPGDAADAVVSAKRALPGAEVSGPGAAGAKKPKSMPFPPTVQIIANKGGGDCLFYAIAQAVSEVECSKVGHRQVRAALADWEVSNSDVLSPHWDGLGPDSKDLRAAGFSAYCDAIRKQGSWGGYLEVFATSVAHGLNILVLCRDAVHKFPANAQDRGHYIVLKYDAAHYEYVRMESKDIATLWLTAVVPDFKGRRGAGLDFGAYEAGSSAGSASTRGRGRGLAVASASLGRGGPALDFAAYEAGSSARSVSSGGRGRGLAFSRYAASGTSQASGAPVCKGSKGFCGAFSRPASSCSSGACPDSTVAWTAATVRGAAEVAEPAFAVAPAEPAMPKFPSKYFVRPGLYRSKCDLCPFVKETDSARYAGMYLHQHRKFHHGGAGCPGPRKVVYGVGRLKAGEVAAWRCPVAGCRFGITWPRMASLGSRTTVCKHKLAHRLAKHPDLSVVQYRALGAARSPAVGARARVRVLNRFAERHLREDIYPKGFKIFTWPYARGPKGKRKLVTPRVGQCPSCRRTFRTALAAKVHTCSLPSSPVVLRRRIKKLHALLARPPSGHGLDQGVFEGMCRAAIAAFEDCLSQQ